MSLPAKWQPPNFQQSKHKNIILYIMYIFYLFTWLCHGGGLTQTYWPVQQPRKPWSIHICDAPRKNLISNNSDCCLRSLVAYGSCAWGAPGARPCETRAGRVHYPKTHFALYHDDYYAKWIPMEKHALRCSPIDGDQGSCTWYSKRNIKNDRLLITQLYLWCLHLVCTLRWCETASFELHV